MLVLHISKGKQRVFGKAWGWGGDIWSSLFVFTRVSVTNTFVKTALLLLLLVWEPGANASHTWDKEPLCCLLIKLKPCLKHFLQRLIFRTYHWIYAYTVQWMPIKRSFAHWMPTRRDCYVTANAISIPSISFIQLTELYSTEAHRLT